MQLVHECRHAPGEAVGRGGSADVIDTGIDVGYFSGRLYLHPKDAREAGVAAGLVAAEDLAFVTAERDRYRDERDSLAVEVHALKQVVEEAESLRNAIAFTLERGIVVDKRGMAIGLRHKPGQQRIDVGRSLWQGYVEAVVEAEGSEEQEAAAA